jgi:radical SAM superfamily enzyme YgiQ (UPF0313 family)
MKVMLMQCPANVNQTIGPPLGLGYIASCLEAEGHKLKLVDSIILRYGLDKLKKEIKHFDPDVLGISAVSADVNKASLLVKAAKEYNTNCLTVLGGVHPTIRARETLEMCQDVDVVIRGEGEITFVDLLEKKKKTDFIDVKGISFRLNGKIIDTQDRPLIEDLDRLPFPAYHLFPMEKYKINEKIWNLGVYGKQGDPYTAISTCRGCSYDCIFCGSRTLWGKKWRARSPENIIEELRFLRDKYGFKIIEFMDDTCTYNKKRMIQICRLIKKENLDISWLCATRVDLFDKELSLEMKKAGCHIVFFGFESGVQKTLDFLCKGFTVEDTVKAVKTAKKTGLKVGGPFIIGIPGETKETINKTISFAKSLHLDFISFNLLLPFPGTKIYEIAEKNNWLVTTDFSKFDFSSQIMNLPDLKYKTLKNSVLRAYVSCCINPSYIYKIIKRNLYESHLEK